MVYGDYELIHTKRVNRQRKTYDILNSRYREARGSHATLFYTLTGAGAAVSFLGIKPTEIIPTAAFFTKTGFKAYMRHAGVRFILPTSFAYSAGVLIFGDHFETENLATNAFKFRKEMTDYHKELYYS